MGKPTSAEIIAQLQSIYDSAVAALSDAMADYAATGRVPGPEAVSERRFCYPSLNIDYREPIEDPGTRRSFARLTRAGRYRTTVTRPAMFAGYLGGQLDLLLGDYDVEISVGRSDQQIPFPYVLDMLPPGTLADTPPTELARYFPSTELAEIGDEIADGLFLPGFEGERPLALFDALRTDFSLAACGIIPARRPSMCSATSCSPITIAMSTSSSAGAARSSSAPAPGSRRCRAPVVWK